MANHNFFTCKILDLNFVFGLRLYILSKFLLALFYNILSKFLLANDNFVITINISSYFMGQREYIGTETNHVFIKFHQNTYIIKIFILILPSTTFLGIMSLLYASLLSAYSTTPSVMFNLPK
jgi:hypothetical protein